MNRSSTCFPQIAVLVFAVLLPMCLQVDHSIADVTFFGSITPDPPVEVNVELNLVVGLEGAEDPDFRGYLLVDGGSKMEYNSLIIGDDEDYQGMMIVSGTLTPGGQTSLVLDDAGTSSVPTVQIGHEGVGQLTIEGGGSMILENTSADLSIGVETSGIGTMIVTDPFSLVVLPDSHFIGDEGIGRMEILNGGVVRNTDTTKVATIGFAATAVGTVLVEGPGSIWKIDNNLVIGQDGVGTLKVSDLGLVDADQASKATTVGPRGRLELAGGTYAGQEIGLDGYLGGSGIVRGSVTGSVDALFDVPEGALLQFTDVVFNQGSIHVQRGEVEFLAGLENLAQGGESASGRITLEDGRMRFMQPLANQGVIALVTGSNHLHGAITNSASGVIVLASDTVGTFYDTVDVGDGSLNLLTGANGLFLADLMFMSESQAALHIGDVAAQSAQIFVEGEAALAGELDVSWVGELSPNLGDSFSLLFAAEGVTGEFGHIALPTLELGLLWNLDYGSNEVVLSIIETIPGDFDLDDDVDGNDFLLWQQGGSPKPLSTSDLVAWQASYGTFGSPTGVATTAVPEPKTRLMLMLGLAAMLTCRNMMVTIGAAFRD
jgi:T5SS/PEP-CTERM-associated repeat protein